MRADIDFDERREKLEQAEEKIQEARELIREAMEDTGEEGVIDHYTLPWLNDWCVSESQCGSLADLKSRLDEAEQEEEDDEG